MTFSPTALRTAVGSGLLSFPVTHFTADGRFDEEPYRKHVAWMAGYAPAALFAAGGTGEFFSLTLDEVPRHREGGRAVRSGDHAAHRRRRLRHAPWRCRSHAPRRARARMACCCCRIISPDAAGGPVPPRRGGLRRVGLGVIVYNRDNCVLTPTPSCGWPRRCPNLIGFKDGVGNVELLMAVRHRLGDRLTYVGGMPTAEVYALAARPWASRPTRRRCSTSSRESALALLRGGARRRPGGARRG